MDTTLQSGATYIADTGGASPQTNFTAPDITRVSVHHPGRKLGVQVRHQLAAVARALGADGRPARPGFLRPRRCWRSSSSPTRTTARRRQQPLRLSTLDPRPHGASSVSAAGSALAAPFSEAAPTVTPPTIRPPGRARRLRLRRGSGDAHAGGDVRQQIKALKSTPRARSGALDQGPATPTHSLVAPPVDTGPWPKRSFLRHGGPRISPTRGPPTAIRQAARRQE
jgi:hypothetical protein